MNSLNFKEEYHEYFDSLDMGNDLELDNIKQLVHLSNLNSILFYNVSTDIKSISIFKERINSADFGLIIIDQINDQILNALKGKNFGVILGGMQQFKSLLLDRFYPVSQQDLKVVGVTGTNGKSSVVSLCLGLAKSIGKNAISIGTLGVYNEKEEQVYPDLQMTSPPYAELREIIYQNKDKVDVIFLEVSSHALAQNRYQNLNYDMAAWITFSQDHLDFHESMEEYFEAKKLILNFLKPNASLYVPSTQRDLLKNINDAKACMALPLRAYELKNLPKAFKVTYNLENLEVALSIIHTLYDVKSFDLKDVHLPLGRFSIIEKDKKIIVIDYAHTPDALEKVCLGCNEVFPKKFKKLLFGCGGNRDKKKRIQMGEKASVCADFLYLTSDNPRDENPEDILNDIVEGVDQEFKRITNRRDCINEAVKNLSSNEVLIIAGKGHESYQEINGIRNHFSDFDEVNKALKQ